MSKIVRAANVMVSNAVKISNVIKRGKEYFFLYDDKYKWSIIFDANEKTYRLFFYPTEISIEQLASISAQEWEAIDFVTYDSKDLKTREAYDTFNELYRTVNEKLLGISDVLDDIIKDDVSF